jgi:uncharacterized protein YggE
MDEYVEMTGTGIASGVPDMASLRLGVSHQAEDVAQAMVGCARAADAVVGVLNGAGIAPSDRQTTGIEVARGYDHREDRPSGYRCTQGIVVRVRQPDRLGELIGGCGAAAGDGFRLDDLSWSFADADQLRRRAREGAWDDARERAQQVATLAGLQLGPALSIVEQAPVPGPWARAASFSEQSSDGGAMPVEAGEGSIVVSLKVRWALLAV